MTSKKAAPRAASAARAPVALHQAVLESLGKHGDVRRFAEALYARMSDAELGTYPAEVWAALAADALAFARTRKAGRPSIRVFSPEAKKNGWDSQRSVLQIVNDDMSFLVDSVTNALTERGIGVHVLIHPVLPISRDKAGKLRAVGEGGNESFMHVEIDRLDNADARALEDTIAGVLTEVRASVEDWPEMQRRMNDAAERLAGQGEPVPAESVVEAQAFLRWAADNHFTFLGYREYAVRKRGKEDVLVAVAGSGLGILREDDSKPRILKSMDAYRVQKAGRLDPLILSKTNARATVHRRGYMDYIGVVRYDASGKPVGEKRFIGLFTSSAYNRRPWEIPVVRSRFDQVMADSGLLASGHSAKTLRHVLETLPRDELFQASAAELAALGSGILGLQERADSRLFIRRDRYGRFYSVLVYVPRERFNTDVRLRIESMLKEVLAADHVESHVLMGDSPLAQIHLIVHPRDDAETVADLSALESRLAGIVRNWRDDLNDLLIERHGEIEGVALAKRYGRALSPAYIEQASPAAAADDVARLAALGGAGDLGISLRVDPAASRNAGAIEVKLFHRNDSLPLSDVLPMMENMGLKVIEEYPHRIEAEDEVAYIQDFEVALSDEAADPNGNSAAFIEAFGRVFRGELENDGFNKLILGAGLSWKRVAMLRAYCKYLMQAGVPFSQQYVEATFARYPLLARLMVEYFEARFDPATGRESKAEIKAGADAFAAQIDVLCRGDDAACVAVKPVIAARSQSRKAQMEATRTAFLGLLDRVKSLDEDRILRSFMGVIDATLRTNYYIDYAGGLRKDGGPADYLAFKLDPSLVPDLPKPRPYREIWVCGPRVEGTHLRFGPVARGGLRWSDRREDFRTEVLGLVKAQMVKNTVIVPVGSKGGFFAKQLPDPAVDRDAWFAEGVACYKCFINGLLDITDNFAIDGKIVPPAGVVRHDGDDPYLVVAADKGTATFSDIANGIAQAHGFWLDDAFASGGSVGYDHKGMGITARGAWESVKRHFRALGHDTQKQAFTVVGIGDMSGDVFGNGMLLSKHIRLVCAFDHRHVFIDPNPDAARSFRERQRLFKLPRSSWLDYDSALISKGGGVFSRAEKSIELTPEMRAALGIDPEVRRLSPTELISAALKAPVDLLWNGGIGTYVKSSRESDADAGDRANNALRVNGADLRCKVVGEGGNLGFTQLGRVEAAQHGVLLNTDFIDNSAGVDTSDHEVNIKILLNGEVQKGKLKLADRNKLLASMTDEVARLVLNDNYRQNQTLSLMERMGQARLGSKLHFLRTLEAQGQLDRNIEHLPSDAEMAERKARGQGFTRPELCVLLSYSKLVAYPQLLDSDVPEDPYLSKELVRYFPEPLQAKYAKTMEHHRLKREIIATAVTNSTINRMGATFLMRMQEDSGRSIGDIAKAYTITRETLDARELWVQIDALDGKAADETQIDALQVIWEAQRGFTRWLLSRPGAIPSITAAVDRYHDGFRDIRAGEGILPPSQRPAYEAARKEWRAKGVPARLADQLAALPYLEPSPNIIELARERKLRAVEVAKVYFRLGDALREPWLREQIEALKVDGRWHAVARGVLRDELAAQMRKLTEQVLAMPGKDAEAKVTAWLERDDPTLRFTLAMLNELAAQKTLDYPTVSVAVQRLAQLASRG
ncbi:NAD-glutamate dehydrogenase [Lysobacter pythonis]|uniref:NAD-glutamate dehydrogenase n=1 Tax=Solilutibacter pythonis TaxID=2483112 RepID=A0A3M2I5W7_9GAMM|nr:NAD-glutamate dehydrogenase domain-containing protein [Lysobacter pythonis]RMH94929.1 NAD-glutamate dehydrogenase [Lysobacter pythonis]